jgi:two-component system invasion response regulator UvrY
MVRILVVDDHPLVRQGIMRVLQEEFLTSEIGEASNGADALNAICSRTWNLVLLDISLPGRNGIDLLKEITAASANLPVLILSTYPEAQFAIRSLRAGAAGYLNKESPPETLIAAVRQTLDGRKFISSIVADQLAEELTIDPSKPIHESLSDREYDVMLRLAGGSSVSHVASAINLSVKTISTYRARILQKMHMKSNADLSQYAIRNKLID